MASSSTSTWFPKAKGRPQCPKYHDFLLHNLQNVIEALHSKGAMRFAVARLPPVGCLPIMITSNRTCVVEQNNDSISYNEKLKDVITRLNSQLKGVKVSYGNTGHLQSLDGHGFNGTLNGCCGLEIVSARPLCTKDIPICPDPSKYLFWDAIHPSEAANKYLAINFEMTALKPLY